MSVLLPFTKMEGCGNDFVVVHQQHLPAEFGPEAARTLCDRRTGIGADGVLVVAAGDSLSQEDIEAGAGARMTVWNADGSIAEMCGNGLRCVTRTLADEGQLPAGSGQVMTGAGLMPVQDLGGSIRVAAGRPSLPQGASPLEIDWQGHTIRGLVVSMGNPHFVVFADDNDPTLPDLREWGPDIETDPAFPLRTNVEWALTDSSGPARVRMRVWERGVGETQACGSGACAVAAAAQVTGRAAPGSVEILLPGGSLKVDWPGRDGDLAFIEGPASTVFVGEWRGTL